MNMIKSLWIMLLSVNTVMFTLPAQSTTLSDALSDGRHLLMIRHADAPGFSDPPHLKIGDCSTQRNLGERGRKQAQALGVWLSQQGIDSAEVLSSAWCRCVDTATLLAKGPVTVAPALGSFFRNMSDSESQTQALRSVLAQRIQSLENTVKPKKPLILVTHQVNISAYTGGFVGQGDVILVKVDERGHYVSHQMVPVPTSN
jgi:phosphohistidine phosphatase SixA